MTDYDLLNLKQLAQRAKPLNGDNLPNPTRVRANGEFFVAAHLAVPDLVDEVLELRRQVSDLKQATLAPEQPKEGYKVGQHLWFKYSNPPVDPKEQYAVGTEVTIIDRESGRLLATYRVLSTDERQIEGVITNVYPR